MLRKLSLIVLDKLFLLSKIIGSLLDRRLAFVELHFSLPNFIFRFLVFTVELALKLKELFFLFKLSGFDQIVAIDFGLL